jgi:arylsulfatase A-like enzyme
MNNVVLLIVDTLRADHADPLYREAQKQGWTATKAIAPATWTLPSHVSMITGLYPSQHGVNETVPENVCAKRARVALKATDHGILGKLRQQGYHIYILTANPYLTPYFGFTLYDKHYLLRRREATAKTFNILAENKGKILKAALTMIKRGEAKTLAEAAAKYLAINVAKHFPQIHAPAPPFDKGAKAIMRKLEETELKEPFMIIINMMEAHPPYTKLEGWAELSYLVPKIVDAVMCTGQAPKWAQKIWRQAYPQHARYAAQIAAEMAKKLAQDAHVIVTSDHGEALGPAVFHGIPPTPELAEVPFITTTPAKIQGVISLTEIPKLIQQLVQNQPPQIGQKIAKTEYHISPKRYSCAKHQKITLYYTQKHTIKIVEEEF